jgi:hypothetical protein
MFCSKCVEEEFVVNCTCGRKGHIGCNDDMTPCCYESEGYM